MLDKLKMMRQICPDKLINQNDSFNQPQSSAPIRDASRMRQGRGRARVRTNPQTYIDNILAGRGRGRLGSGGGEGLGVGATAASARPSTTDPDQFLNSNDNATPIFRPWNEEPEVTPISGMRATRIRDSEEETEFIQVKI